MFLFDTAFIKAHKDLLAAPIAHLINLSLKHCTFPDAWKCAIVTPIHKSGDRLDACNYRPISILPMLSKVAEKVVADQLTTFLNTGEFGLHRMQFGFRANHSTETATLQFIEHVKSRLDKEAVAGTVFLDLSKAFDTVNHAVMLSKLSCFNFSNTALAWMSSYLSNRRQCVKVGDTLSSVMNCTMGVPQGSVLGPLLFSMYINNLPQHCPQDIHLQMYADDTVVWTYAATAALAAVKLTAALESITKWLEESGLSLNVSKTKAMFFHKKPRKMAPTADIFIKGVKVDVVSDFKYLGVVLDSNLNFKSHVKKKG